MTCTPSQHSVENVEPASASQWQELAKQLGRSLSERIIQERGILANLNSWRVNSSPNPFKADTSHSMGMVISRQRSMVNAAFPPAITRLSESAKRR